MGQRAKSEKGRRILSLDSKKDNKGVKEDRNSKGVEFKGKSPSAPSRVLKKKRRHKSRRMPKE